MAPSKKSKKKKNTHNLNKDLTQKVPKKPKVQNKNLCIPIIPLKLDKPIPNLKTVPLSTQSECDAIIALSNKPPKVNSVDLHLTGSPHSPIIKKKTKSSETKQPEKPTTTTADTVKSSEEMTKRKNKAASKWVALHAKKLLKTPGENTMQLPEQNTKQLPGQNTMQLPGQNTKQLPGQNTKQLPGQNTKQLPGQNTKQLPGQNTMQLPGQNPMQIPGQNTMQLFDQSTMQLPGQTQKKKTQKATMHGAQVAQVDGIPVNAIQFGPGQPFGPPKSNLQVIADQTRPFNNQQKKKWLKFQKKLLEKQQQEKKVTVPHVIPEEPPLPEMSQDGSPSILLTQANEPAPAGSKGGADTGQTMPKIQKPNITFNMKKNLQQDKTRQLANVPETSTTAQDSPQIVKAPPATVAEPLPGLTIPRLENRTTEPVARSSAGSFFKKAPSKAKKANPFETYPPTSTYYPFYAKGIPRSFIRQQEKSLEAGGTPITADSPIWPVNPNPQFYHPENGPTLAQQPTVDLTDDNIVNLDTSPIFVQTENQPDVQQPYSPSDVYSEQATNPEPPELEAESPDPIQSGQKRLSAFQRLGPVSQPKKPKLTINLNLNKEQPVREVVNETDDDPDKYTPVHLRQDIITSTDETVVKWLHAWPWRKNVPVRRSATARSSRSVMILEQEKMEEAYEKDNIFIQITVKGYPSTWKKEQVLDAVLESVRGYSLIPCFIEFYQHECKFLVLRSRSALIVLHKTGFYIHKDGVELAITISVPVLSEQMHFIPRIVLRKRMVMGYTDKKLNLSAFTMQNDISHFIYYPLNRLNNQSDCIQLQTAIDWNQLVELDLSHNRLTTISGFDLANLTPKLKHLDLSHNCLEKITCLLNDRHLPLKTIRLEGNPLCHDYIDPDHYVKVIRMMFPEVVEIDGVPIKRKGELPNPKQNYCPEGAQEVAEKFLEIYFPLLDSGSDHRAQIQGMYDEDACLTVTYCYKLRYGQIYRNYRNLFLYARFLDEGETDSVVGAMAITKLINRWPHTEHDPFTFTVDALYHTEDTTILRIGGVLKLTAETLADDEHLLSFTRTVVLHSEDGAEYKIYNEMVYWYEPTADAASAAFRVNTISQKNFNLKIEATTDEDLRDKYLKIFMKLTTMDEKISERCLEINDWNFKLALEHFTKLLKLNNLDSLTQEIQVVAPAKNN